MNLNAREIVLLEAAAIARRYQQCVASRNRNGFEVAANIERDILELIAPHPYPGCSGVANSDCWLAAAITQPGGIAVRQIIMGAVVVGMGVMILSSHSHSTVGALLFGLQIVMGLFLFGLGIVKLSRKEKP